MSYETVYLVELWQADDAIHGHGFLSNVGVYESRDDALDTALFHCKAFDDPVDSIEGDEVKTHIITRSRRRFTISAMYVLPLKVR